MELNCVIVDDEPLALNLLEDYVKRTPFLKLVAKCGSGVEALSIIHENDVDLAFMDIQMPGLNGLELSKMLENCAVIFTTAFEQYAIEGFKVNAIDYLLKPFSYAEFLVAANKAQKQAEIILAAKGNKTSETPINIVVKADYRQQVVNTNDIMYIEGVRDYIRIIMENGTDIQTLMSLKAAEEMLPHNNFIRVHRSFIVNIDKVKTIERNNIVFGKHYIPISDSYRDEFNRLFSSRTINW